MSVIVRTKDRPQLLALALDSVVAQSHRPIELVVVNDGGEEVAELLESRLEALDGLRYVAHDAPHGRSAAANAGLQLATGDLLLFLDDDDEIDADHLAALVAALRANPGVAAAYAGVRLVADDGESLGELNRPFSYPRLVKGNYIPIHGVLFSRSLLDQGVRFDESLAVYEDWDFWLQVAQHTALFHVDRISASYRQGGGSGVGLGCSAADLHRHRARVLEKWLGHWSGEVIDLAFEDADREAREHVDGLERVNGDLARIRGELEQRCADHSAHISDLSTHLKNTEKAREAGVERFRSLAQAAAERGRSLTAECLRQMHESARRGALIEGYRQRVAEEVAWRRESEAELQRQLAESDAAIAGLRGEMARLETQIGALSGVLEAMRRSTSWRVSAPLRWVRRLLSGSPVGPVEYTTTAVSEAVEAEPPAPASAAAPPAPPVIEEPMVGPPQIDYPHWNRLFDTLDGVDLEVIRRRIDGYEYRPLISVLMPTYNSPERFLRQAIDSVRQQIYPHWELCIADDASTSPRVRAVLEEAVAADSRIKVCFREENGPICAASNRALALAEGEFVALLDHDDELPSHALYCVVEELHKHRDAQVIYSDEDKIDEEGRRSSPCFKPDWSPDLLLSHNMISRFGVYRTATVHAVGGFREGYQGAQDWDLALRVVEQAGDRQVRHLRRVLYHRRSVPGSTAGDLGTEAKPHAATSARRAIQDHLERRGVAARAEDSPLLPGTPRVRYSLPAQAGAISLIYLVEEGDAGWQGRLERLLEGLDGVSPEVVVAGVEGIPGDAARVAVGRGTSPAQTLNRAVARASGELLCFLSSRLEPLDGEWLTELASHAARPELGAVGARLLAADGRLRHAGTVFGIGDGVGYPHAGFSADHSGYCDRAMLIQNFLAVSGECLAVRRSAFEEVDGFDESEVSHCLHFVELCLRLVDRGYRNLWTPFAQLRAVVEVELEGGAQRADEIERLRARWSGPFRYDPYSHPAVILGGESPGLSWSPGVPPLY
ncbi:hypothetical protein JCM17961_17600 [Endothiovibrio diazotrophicus]